MKTRLLTLALALLAVGHLSANVNVRTNGAPVIPGTVVHLSWQRPSPTQKSDVDVSYDNGTSWTEIASGLDQDSMEWKIPEVGFEVLRFRVRLEKLQTSTYEIPTSYRRPGSTSSKAWSPNGDTLITIETTDSTCHVLRTSLVSGRTEKIWGATNTSGWGRISRDLSCAFIALKGGGLIRVDLSNGVVEKTAYNVKMMEIVEKNNTVAILDSLNDLRLIENLTLRPLRKWSLGAPAQTKNFFVVGERVVVVDAYWQSLVFTVDDPNGIWSPTMFEKLGNSDTLVISNRKFVDIRTYETIHELPFPIVPCAISENERFVVSMISSWDGYSGYWFIDLRSKTHFQIPFGTLTYDRKIAFSKRDSCLYVSRNGVTTELSVKPSRIDTTAKINYTTTDFLVSGGFAFYSDVLQYTFTLDSLQRSVKDDHVQQVVPSPDPRFVVIRRSAKVELLDRTTGLATCIIELLDKPLTYKWSATGDRALISDGRTIGILDIKKSQFQKIYKADTMKVVTNMESTEDLSRVFWVIDAIKVYAWNSMDQTMTIIPWKGSYTVGELCIDERSDLLSARLHNVYYSSHKIVRTSIAHPIEFSNFEFRFNSSSAPENIQYHTYDTTRKIVLLRETVPNSVIRLTAWSYEGTLLWYRVTTHPSSPSSGPHLLLGTGRFAIRSTTEDHLYDMQTGTVGLTVPEHVLAEVADGMAYIVLRTSNDLEGHASLDLTSTSFNERFSLTNHIQFKNTVFASEHFIHYRSDSSWVVMMHPGAILDVDTTLFSAVLEKGTVTHVSLLQDELMISTTDVERVENADIRIYDIQGRLLATINGVDLAAGVTRIPTHFDLQTRYALIQISKNDRPLFCGSIAW